MRQMHSGEEEFVQETELLPGRSLDTNLCYLHLLARRYLCIPQEKGQVKQEGEHRKSKHGEKIFGNT
jgi:hypothetical protein